MQICLFTDKQTKLVQHYIHFSTDPSLEFLRSLSTFHVMFLKLKLNAEKNISILTLSVGLSVFGSEIVSNIMLFFCQYYPLAF